MYSGSFRCALSPLSPFFSAERGRFGYNSRLAIAPLGRSPSSWSRLLTRHRSAFRIPSRAKQFARSLLIKKTSPFGRVFLIRRGGDSNSRYLSVWRFSKPLVSATHAPLQSDARYHTLFKPKNALKCCIRGLRMASSSNG